MEKLSKEEFGYLYYLIQEDIVKTSGSEEFHNMRKGILDKITADFIGDVGMKASKAGEVIREKLIHSSKQEKSE